MNVDNVIDFLRDAENKTYSSEDKYHLFKARKYIEQEWQESKK